MPQNVAHYELGILGFLNSKSSNNSFIMYKDKFGLHGI